MERQEDGTSAVSKQAELRSRPRSSVLAALAALIQVSNQIKAVEQVPYSEAEIPGQYIGHIVRVTKTKELSRKVIVIERALRTILWNLTNNELTNLPRNRFNRWRFFYVWHGAGVVTERTE